MVRKNKNLKIAFLDVANVETAMSNYDAKGMT